MFSVLAVFVLVPPDEEILKENSKSKGNIGTAIPLHSPASPVVASSNNVTAAPLNMQSTDNNLNSDTKENLGAANIATTQHKTNNVASTSNTATAVVNPKTNGVSNNNDTTTTASGSTQPENVATKPQPKVMAAIHLEGRTYFFMIRLLGSSPST